MNNKKSPFLSLLGPSSTDKSTLIHIWLKIGTLNKNFKKTLLFSSTFPATLRCYARINWKCRVFQGVHFELMDSLKNDGTKCLLIFDDSCEVIYISKAFVEIATAGGHRWLSTIYIKHNLFHQSKLGRDVELENTHIVPFIYPFDEMPVSKLSAQLGFESELIDSRQNLTCQDATSVLYGYLLIDLRPQTDDRLRYFTNTVSFPHCFTARIGRSNQNFWTMNTHNPSTLQEFQSQMQELFASVLSKRNYPLSLRMHSKPSQRKPTTHKKTSRDSVSKRSSVAFPKKVHVEAEKGRSDFWKKPASHQSHNSSHH